MKKLLLRNYPTGVYGNDYHKQTPAEVYAQLSILNNFGKEKSGEPFHTDLIADLKKNTADYVSEHLLYIAQQEGAKKLSFIFYLDFLQALKERMENAEYLTLVDTILGRLDVSLEAGTINGHTEDIESHFANFILPHSKYGLYTNLEHVKMIHDAYFEKYAEHIV